MIDLFENPGEWEDPDDPIEIMNEVKIEKKVALPDPRPKPKPKPQPNPEPVPVAPEPTPDPKKKEVDPNAYKIPDDAFTGFDLGTEPYVDDPPIRNPEKMPQFPGGEQALYNWLGKHIVYPRAAKDAGATGIALVEFVVDKTGKITDMKIVRSPHPAIDAELKKKLQNMPDWIPGYQGGLPVSVRFVWPINFSLRN